MSANKLASIQSPPFTDYHTGTAAQMHGRAAPSLDFMGLPNLL